MHIKYIFLKLFKFKAHYKKKKKLLPPDQLVIGKSLYILFFTLHFTNRTCLNNLFTDNLLGSAEDFELLVVKIKNKNLQLCKVLYHINPILSLQLLDST